MPKMIEPNQIERPWHVSGTHEPRIDGRVWPSGKPVQHLAEVAPRFTFGPAVSSLPQPAPGDDESPTCTVRGCFYIDRSLTAVELEQLTREAGDDAGAELLFGSRGQIHTSPGDLDDTKRSAEGIGLWLVIGVIGAVGSVSLLAHYWPKIIAWGGW